MSTTSSDQRRHGSRSSSIAWAAASAPRPTAIAADLHKHDKKVEEALLVEQRQQLPPRVDRDNTDDNKRSNDDDDKENKIKR